MEGPGSLQQDPAHTSVLSRSPLQHPGILQELRELGLLLDHERGAHGETDPLCARCIGTTLVRYIGTPLVGRVGTALVRTGLRQKQITCRFVSNLPVRIRIEAVSMVVSETDAVYNLGSGMGYRMM